MRSSPGGRTRSRTFGARRATPCVLALAGLAAGALWFLVALDGRGVPGSRPETVLAGASGRGDVVPRRRAVPVAAEEPDGEAARPEDVECERDAGADAEDEEDSDEDVVADEPPVSPPLEDPRTVRIVDADGRPIPGAWLDVDDRSWARTRWVRTDEFGEARFDAADLAGPVTFFDGERRRAVDLTGQVTEARAAAVPRLVVSAVDATTGIPLGPLKYELVRSDQRLSGWTSTAGPAVGDNERGEARICIRIEHPAGRGGFDEIVWDGALAPRARRALLVVPLFETTERTFRLVLPDGRPAVGAAVTGAHAVAAQATRAWHAELTWNAEPADAEGIVRVTGLPRIPFSRIDVSFSWRGETGGRVRRLMRTVNEIDPFAPSPDVPIVAVLDVSGKYRDPSSAPPPPESPPPIDGPTAALSVRAVHRDGVPARRVEIVAFGRSAFTDADGRARFDAMPLGALTVLAKGHGFVPTLITADVRSDEALEIREAETRPVRVLVTDRDDNPVPSAAVVARCVWVRGPDGVRIDADCDVAQMDGDTENLVPRTDRNGVVVLQLPRGGVEVTAVLGAADGSNSMAGERDEVRVVLSE